jgi:hypothetical protein
MVIAMPSDAATLQRNAMTRETRTALRRAEMLAAAAELTRDDQAVDLAEGLIEAAWSLLRHLSADAEPRSRPRPRRRIAG